MQSVDPGVMIAVARALVVATRFPNTAENICGSVSLARAVAQYELLTPATVDGIPVPPDISTFWRPPEVT